MITVYEEKDEMKQVLFNSLYLLMIEYPIDKLSVNDICEHAHVSRATFYRHFKDKYDLFNKTYENILQKTLFKYKENSWKKSIYAIYQVLEENHEFFNNAIHSQDFNSFRNYLYKQAFNLECEILKMNGIDPTEGHHYYRIVGYASSGVAITMRWLERKIDLSLDELVDLLYEIVPYEYKEFFK